MTVLKVIRFNTWIELLREALRLESLGYTCEVKGFEDMRHNKLTVYADEVKE